MCFSGPESMCENPLIDSGLISGLTAVPGLMYPLARQYGPSPGLFRCFGGRRQQALKGHGFSRAVTCAWRVGLQPPEGIRTSAQHRSPSVAKAIIMTAAYGMAEAVPLQSVKSS